MKKITISTIYLMITLFLSVHLTAQFDDLYFETSDYDYNTTSSIGDDLAYEDTFDDASYGEEEAIYAYDEDEYDEYNNYRDADYDVDAFNYTNRFNRFRYSSLYGGLYGRNALINNRFNRGFGSGIVIIGGANRFGVYDPFAYNRFGAFNRTGFNRFGAVGFGSGFNRFGGAGFGGSAYACPPYSGIGRANTAAVLNNTAPRVATPSRTSSRTGARTVRTTNTPSRSVRSTSSRSTTPRATSGSRSRTVSPSTRSKSRSVRSTSTRSSSRSARPASSSRSSRATSTSRSRSSFTPRTSSGRSSSVRSSSPSRSSSVRSSSSRSSSSSSRGRR